MIFFLPLNHFSLTNVNQGYQYLIMASFSFLHMIYHKAVQFKKSVNTNNYYFKDKPMQESTTIQMNK